MWAELEVSIRQFVPIGTAGQITWLSFCAILAVISADGKPSDEELTAAHEDAKASVERYLDGR